MQVRKNKKKTAVSVLTAVLIAILSAMTLVCADYVGAGGESYSWTNELSRIELAEHTSYVTDMYENVIHVQVSDKNVVSASSDSDGRVVITAIGSGTATVSFWYKLSYYAADDSWTRVIIPVTVSGKSISSRAETLLDTGIQFESGALTLSPGEEGTIANIKVNGNDTDSAELYWITSNSLVIRIDSATGQYEALQTGTAVIYAVTADGRFSSCITVSVN